MGNMVVDIPRGDLDDRSLEILKKMVERREPLIRKVVGAEEIPIIVTDEKVSFPWFSPQDESDETAYRHLIEKLVNAAKRSKRAVSGVTNVANEKYAFRCFLLRLGFIGPEYKKDRKILLRNLRGSSAFRDKMAVKDLKNEQKG